MSVRSATRRKHRRYRTADDAFVEFEYPRAKGRPCRLRVEDLSASGLSFVCEDDSLGRVEVGTSIPQAVVRVGECSIRADLVVMHLTREGSRRVCGALLYPSSDTDILMLKGVVAGLTAAGS